MRGREDSTTDQLIVTMSLTTQLTGSKFYWEHIWQSSSSESSNGTREIKMDHTKSKYLYLFLNNNSVLIRKSISDLRNAKFQEQINSCVTYTSPTSSAKNKLIIRKENVYLTNIDVIANCSW